MAYMRRKREIIMYCAKLHFLNVYIERSLLGGS
jgi:hypothetical protein